MKNEEDNFIVNIPPLHETLEEKRPYLRTKKKLKRTNIPINSLETAIDEDDYDFYVPSIPKIVLKVKYIQYKWEKSAVSRGCSNAANTSKRAARPEKGCENNTSIIEILK